MFHRKAVHFTVVSSFLLTLSFFGSHDAEASQIWRLEFDDGSTSEYLQQRSEDDYGSSFGTAVESGGILTLSDPHFFVSGSDEGMFIYLDFVGLPQNFVVPSDISATARVKINSSRTPGSYGDSLYDTNDLGTLQNNTWITVQSNPVNGPFGDAIGIRLIGSLGSWLLTDSLEIDWIQLESPSTQVRPIPFKNDWTITETTEKPGHIERDSTGNLYISSGRWDGFEDGFFAKHDSSGTRLWKRGFSGGWKNLEAMDLVGDSIYVAGRDQNFGESMDLDFGPGETLVDDAAFLASYDLDGDYAWSAIISQPSDIPEIVAIHAAADGSVYVTGNASGSETTTFSGNVIDTDGLGAFFFTAKYGSTGTLLWVRIVGIVGDGRVRDVATDGSHVYVTGDIWGDDIDFDPTSGNDPRDVTSISAFLSRYDVNGNYEWTKVISGTSDVVGRVIGTDAQQNVYLAGTYKGTVDFDPGSGSDVLSGTGVSSMFITSYTEAGAYRWMNGTEDPAIFPESVQMGPDGVFVVGEQFGSIDFDIAADIEDVYAGGTGDGGSASFLVSYSFGGSYDWARILSPSSSYSVTWMHDVVLDLEGNLFVAGHFYSESNQPNDLDVTDASDLRVAADGEPYTFLSKYSPLDIDGGDGGGGSGESGGGGGTNLDGSKYSYNYYPVTLDINATIAISCDSSVAMSAIVGTGKSAITLSGNKATDNMAMCNVNTNNASGYKMEWNSSATHEASGALKSTTDASDTINPYSISGSSESWSIDPTLSEWGAKIGASSEGYGAGNGTGDYTYTSAGGWGTNDGYDNGKWMNVPTTPFQIMQKSTETDVDGEYQYLVFGAEIGADKLQPTGTYTQEVTVTATTL